MPEGRYPLAQATLYLATAPKSNSTMGFFDALATVEREREREVPNPLRDANRDKEGFGHGQGYLYPHSYREHWVEQQYLPSGLQGQVFYQPSDQGYEASIQTQVARRREAQLAALVDGGGALPEALTYSPNDPARDRWLQRTISQAGEQVGWIRDRIFSLAPIQRHHRILDLNARTGLLVWEAVRQVPEGGVYARVQSQQDKAALEELAARLPELSRPVLLQGDLEDLDQRLWEHTPGLRCDRILGRNALGQTTHREQAIQALTALLAEGGVITLAETIPRHSQHISALVDTSGLTKALAQRWQKADVTITQSTTDSRFNWDAETLKGQFQKAGVNVQLSLETIHNQVYISPSLLKRWFSKNGQPPSYCDQLSEHLSEKDIAAIQQICQRQLQNQTVEWRSQVAFIVAQP
jgi:putative ATPase